METRGILVRAMAPRLLLKELLGCSVDFVDKKRLHLPGYGIGKMPLSVFFSNLI